MANHYTQLSFRVFMSQAHAEWCVALHQTYTDVYDNEDVLEELKAAASQPDYMADVVRMVEADNGCPHVNMDADEKGLSIVGCESANVEYLAALFQTYLNHCHLKHPIGFEWANTCSKMRHGEFAGGACVVTHDDIEWMNTTRWMEETMREMDPASESVLL